MKLADYPHFITYAHTKRDPSVVKQQFFSGYIDDGKPLYPDNELLRECLVDPEQRLRFGAAMFCGFLYDTIGVEHHVVIPSILSLHELPISFPEFVTQEMYKFVTDEGHHAAQSLCLIDDIRKRYYIEIADDGFRLPLFVRRLFAQRETLALPVEKALFMMVIGIVTETRISVELGRFASDNSLTNVVREACRQHQEDEAVHSSQFRALGEWSWMHLSPELKSLAAKLYVDTMVARSYPDANRIAFYLSQATGRTKTESQKIIGEIYTEKILRSILLAAAEPTIRFRKKLGVLDYPEAQTALTTHGITI
jgi:hypothetical protein